MSETIIRMVEAKDERRWRELWSGYVKFYRGEVADDVTANTWKRILDPASNIDALAPNSLMLPRLSSQSERLFDRDDPRSTSRINDLVHSLSADESCL